MNAAANLAERMLRPGHGGNNQPAEGPDVTTDVSNPDRDPSRYADPSGEKMKALAWMGKNKVEMGTFFTR